MIIAIDFDGTIVKHRYPEIGEPLKGAVETIKAIIENGHKVFLWTMRGHNKYEGRDLLREAEEYCYRNGIELYNSNCSPSQFSSSPKQYAHIYIDDASLGDICMYVDEQKRPYVDWWIVGKHLIARHVITEKQFNKIWDE